MLVANYKLRQLRPQYGADALVRIGRDMASQGHVGLKVEKERLGVSSLEFLNDFPHLEAISIYGVSRGLAILSQMPKLRSVALCGVTTRDTSFLNGLEHLEELWLQGLRLKDWELLRKLKQVKAITLFNLRLEDFGFLEEMEGLQIIHFKRCNRVVSLPSLKKLHSLRRLVLDTVNRLEDIKGAAEAPSIEDIVVMGADSLSPEEFDCLIGHPTLHGILPGIAPMNSGRYKEVISRLPGSLLMDGFYGTPNEQFSVT